MDEYTPINCGVYDQWILWAQEKRVVKINYVNEFKESSEIETTILDIYTFQGIEYLRTETLVLRLDKILQIQLV